jgi:alpha-tubulin suppressor-like RCC1 family protein
MAAIGVVLAPLTPANAAETAPKVGQVATGMEHSCALDVGGAVLCWGSNYYGQLGTARLRQTPVPIGVTLPGPATSIAAGDYHTCVVVAADVLCWGVNSDRQLGNDSVPGFGAVVKVAGLDGVTPETVEAGADSSCTVTESRELYCWGETAVQRANLGRTMRMDVPGAVTDTDVDRWHGCAATTAGPYCWSVSYDGFQRAAGFPAGAAVALTAGNGATCATSADLDLFCWGPNFYGSVGDGTTEPRPEAFRVALPAPATALGSGPNHVCAGVADGAYCWGSNSSGELGVGDDTWSHPLPTRVARLGDAVTSIEGNTFHSCAVAAGEAYCWGMNYWGQLGDGTSTHSHTPVRVSFPPISAGQ